MTRSKSPSEINLFRHQMHILCKLVQKGFVPNPLRNAHGMAYAAPHA
jgi:hypothetical protein